MPNAVTLNMTQSLAPSTYTIGSAKVKPELQGLWDGPAWGHVPAVKLENFHPRTISRHSHVQAKLLYDHEHAYVHFKADDQHVKVLNTEFQSNVSSDSCVEFFFQPRPDKAYFNFEINAGGALLVFYMADHRRNAMDRFVDFKRLPIELGSQVRIYHSMPTTIPEPIHERVTWQIEAAIPLAILKPYVGEVSTTPGTPWRGNLFKCGGDRDYRHWVSWSQQSPVLNFHNPAYFGNLPLGE